MEEAEINDLFENPLHPYTMGLLASIPGLTKDKSERLQSIPGSPPDYDQAPQGLPVCFPLPVCAQHLRSRVPAVCPGWQPSGTLLAAAAGRRPRAILCMKNWQKSRKERQATNGTAQFFKVRAP